VHAAGHPPVCSYQRYAQIDIEGEATFSLNARGIRRHRLP
jgi:hypothetical protein